MERTPIPIGGSGLLLGTGLYATKPAAIEYLRNVSLRPGRTARRGGLQPQANLSDETDIIGVHPLRALGVTAVVTYDTTTREVNLYMLAPDYTTRLVGTIWTLGPTAPFPKVSLTDVWDKLIIAHDFAGYPRENTRYYTFTPTEGIFDIVAQLNANSAGPAPVKFRGVTRYLTYLVGWGYGTEPSVTPPPDTEDNRPEIVRLSLPDDPLAFDPEHYFICGQRADAVQGCWIAGQTLAARKGTESFTIFGTDRPSFGIVQSDSLFGVASSRLAVTVGEVNYFWSFSGPRRSTGGASEDQALPLDLDNFGLTEQPVLDFDDAFACYDPLEQVVLFVFGTLAYCWHVEVQQWSMRDYAVDLYAGNISLREGAAGGLGPTADCEFDAVRVDATTSAATVQGEVDVVVSGTLLGGEVLQVWGKPRGIGSAVWAPIGSETPVVLGLNTCDVTFTKLGVTWDLACRLTIAGVGGSSYLSANPLTWPAPCQGDVQVALPDIDRRITGGVSGYFETRPITEPNFGAMLFLLDAPPITETHLTYELRQAPAGGAFGPATAVTVFDAAGGPAVRFGIDAIRNTVRDFEVRVLSPELTGAWVAVETNRWAGPLSYASAVVDRESTGQYRWILTAPNEPSYTYDSGEPHLQYNVGGGFLDETFVFSFTPSLFNSPGFASVVYTSALVSGRSNTETQFQARREVTWQGVLYYSIWFTPIFPT